MPTYSDEQERIRQLFGEGNPLANFGIDGASGPGVNITPPSDSRPTGPKPVQLRTQSETISTAYQKALRDRLDKISAKGTPQYGGGSGQRYTMPDFGTGARAEVLKALASQIGVPYSWGGGGAKGKSLGIAQGANTVGFDCSGLVQYAYAKIGWMMPRLAQQQATLGRRVDISRLKPGDLVAGPGHIAVYAGNGLMYEAPRTGLRVRLTRVRSGMVGVALNY